MLQLLRVVVPLRSQDQEVRVLNQLRVGRHLRYVMGFGVERQIRHRLTACIGDAQQEVAPRQLGVGALDQDLVPSFG